MSEHSLNDTVKVWLMSLLSLIISNAQLALGLTLMLANLGYTLWKWRRDYLKEKRDATK
jgi:hypothetical protein